jgi:hypothetical protein
MSEIQKALLGAMRDVCKIGIGKTSKASAGGANYNYRGIDAAMNEMSPILVNNGITVTPKYTELSVTERPRGDPKDGKFSRIATLKGTFQFTAEDGSSVTAEAYGESIDTGDKAIIKAQTVAFRTVLFQQFIVPLMSMDSELHQEDEPTPPANAEAIEAAEKGSAVYEAYFKKLTKEGRIALATHHDELKRIAAEVDAAKAKEQAPE